MKLGLMLFIITALQFGPIAVAQQVTIRQKNISLIDVFKEIHRQTGYGFIYSDKLLMKMAPVNLDIKKETVEQSLRICLANQPLSFSIENKIVTVMEKMRSNSDSVERGIQLTAKVVDGSGYPVISATIRISGSDKITMTNYRGVFSMSNLYPHDTLEISCVGYEPKREAVRPALKTISLKVAESRMDEVQVIAYGQTTNRLSTGSVTTVTAKELEKSSAPNVLEALAGLVPGLSVVSIGSDASAGYRISLRGMNTLGTDPNSKLNPINSPLILLDGLPLSTGVISQTEGGLLQSGLEASGIGQSPLFNINPDDIESISVLKDADATSIYGSMGTNGVILITSKKPKPGKTQVHASVKQGISTQGAQINLLNSSEYFAMRKEALANDQVTPTMANAYDLLIWDKSRSNDWQKQLLGTRPNTSAQLGFTGGKDNFSFRLNSSYYYNDENPGLSNAITELYKEQRGTMDLSLSKQSKDGRLKINFRGALAYIHNDLPHNNPESSIYLAPDAPALIDNNGKVNWSDWRVAKGFPVSVLGLFKPYKSSTHDEDLNAGISYRITDRLEINVLSSYRKTKVDQMQVEQSTETTDPLMPLPVVQSTFGKNDFTIWSVESNMKYNLQLKQGNLQFLAGVQYNRNIQNFDYTSASGWPSGVSQESISGASNLSDSPNDAEIRMASAYGRITYNYSNKYIFNLNARRDGSSNFGDDKKYGNFGSAGAAWIFSREPWMKILTSSGNFSFGKLRASFGTTGLAVSKPYTYSSTVGVNPFLYQGQSTNAFIQPANPDVKWAQTRKLDAAIDLGFFNDRLSLSVDYYNNRTGDIITFNPVTTITGFRNLLFNQPAVVENSGLEASLGFRSAASRKLTWSIGANISMNRNRLVSFPNLSESTYAGYGAVINESINRYYFPPVGSINTKTGTYMTGKQQINYHSIDPDFSGGLQSRVNYKGFELSCDLTFTQQKGLNTVLPSVVPGMIVNGISNQPVSVLPDRWQHPGDVAVLPRFSSIGLGSISSYGTERFYNDASYISLKNARLRYTVDKEVSKRVKADVLSATLTGHNLIYFTKFKGINPELPVDGDFLIRRLFDLAIDLTF